MGPSGERFLKLDTTAPARANREPTDDARADQTVRAGRGGRWFKRLGFAGLVFFTVKGLLWLIVPALVYLWIQFKGN